MITLGIILLVIGLLIKIPILWTLGIIALVVGAVLLILLRVITADEAYSGLNPEILLLIAGIGIAALITLIAVIKARRA